MVLTFGTYIFIASRSRAASTAEFYVAGHHVHPVVNGMATVADWVSAAQGITNEEITMPSAIQLRKRLMEKLSELFQLDQPDLDFGFYRIMHAEIQGFMEADLLKIVADTFGSADKMWKNKAQEIYDRTVQTAKGHMEKLRKFTGDIGKDNLMLDEWLKLLRSDAMNFEIDIMYVNGSNNLPNLKVDGDSREVRLAEEGFMKRMGEMEAA